MHLLHKAVGLVLVIGGINWGLVGAFNFDLVAAIFGSMTVVTRIIYGVVGISAILKLLSCCCGCCSSGSCSIKK